MPDFSDLAYTLGGYKKTNPFDERRKYGLQLMQQGGDTSPIQSPWQGVGRLAQALAGGFDIYQADKDEKGAQTKLAEKITQANNEPDPTKRVGLYSQIDPELGMRLGGQLAIEQAKLQQQQDMLQQGATNFGAGYGGSAPQTGGAPIQTQPLPPMPGYQGTVAGAESRNDPNAVNPTSGASGLYQFMPATAADVRAKHPELNLPPDFKTWSPDQQHAAEAAFRGDNATVLQKGGIQPTPANLYLAHRLGAQGATNVLRANPDAPMSTVVPPEWIAQNPDMRTTVGGFQMMAQNRFRGQGAPPPQAPQGAPSQTQPAQLPPFQQPGTMMAQNAPPPAVSWPQGAGPGVPGSIPAAPPGAIAQAPLSPPGQPPQIAQGGGDGTPPQPNPQGIAGPAVVAPPGVPDVQRPQPSQQQLQQYQRRIQSGEFGIGPEATSKARAALDADLDRQWAVDREKAKAGYDQNFESFKHQRDVGEEESRHQRGLQDKKDNPQYTQEQNLAHTYATRLNNAVPQLEALIRDPSNIPSWSEQQRANSPYVPEGMVSDKAKEFRRITKDIMSSTLRRESGASIHNDEYVTEAQKFIPLPGDPPNVVANKIAALKQAGRSIAEGTGRSIDTYSSFAGGPPAGAGAAPTQGGMPPPPPGFRPLP